MSLLSLIIAIISASCFDWSAFLVNLFGHFVLSLSPCLFLFILLQVKASFSGVKQIYLMFNWKEKKTFTFYNECLCLQIIAGRVDLKSPQNFSLFWTLFETISV